MPPSSNEEQFKFLISCIRYSNNGKVDFGHVAHECKIVSKGAAAKRYERMMRSHGIAPNAASIKPPSFRSLKVERSERRELESPAKRIKMGNKMDAFRDECTADDDEKLGNGTIKLESGEQFIIKEEEEQQHQGGLGLGEAANLLQYYSPDTSLGGYEAGSLGGDDGYGSTGGDLGLEPGSDLGSGYVPAFGMGSTQSFDFSSPYPAGVGVGSLSLSETGNTHYQPSMQYSTDDQAHSEDHFIM